MMGIAMITRVSKRLRLLKRNNLFEAMLWQSVLCAALYNIANKGVNTGERLSEVVADLPVNFEIVITTMHLLWDKLKTENLA